MKRMTLEEFRHRTTEVAKARMIFSHMTDNDITRAFEAYQRILIDEEHLLELVISSRTLARPMTDLDNYERPPCPVCAAELLFRPVPENAEGVKTQLVCSKVGCDTVLNTPYTLDEWRAMLEKKNEPDGNAQDVQTGK